MKNGDMELRIEELLTLVEETQKHTLTIHEKYTKENAASFAEMRRVIQTASAELSAARKAARKELVLWCILGAGIAGGLVSLLSLFLINRHADRMYGILYAIYRLLEPAN